MVRIDRNYFGPQCAESLERATIGEDTAKFFEQDSADDSFSGAEPYRPVRHHAIDLDGILTSAGQSGHGLRADRHRRRAG